PEVMKALRPPPAVYDIVTGATVLEPAATSWLLQPWVLGLLLLLPPAACVLWYAYWRRHLPDAVRELKQRRHRAAELTLRELQSGDPAPHRLATVLTEYLRRRIDLVGAEPTPREVDEHLRRAGVSKAGRARVRDVLQRCDAARFGGESASPALVELSVAAVQAMEGEPCLERHL